MPLQFVLFVDSSNFGDPVFFFLLETLRSMEKVDVIETYGKIIPFIDYSVSRLIILISRSMIRHVNGD